MNLPLHLDLIAAAPEGIRKLRGLILELAVRGKLVPQDPDDEPASELLKRIAQERARLEAEGKIRISKPLPPVGEDEQPYALPEKWTWSRLGQSVIESGAGWSPGCESRPRENDEWGVLKVSAVSWGAFDPAENKALPANLEPRPEHEVVAGDFLVSRANTAELVARSVVVESCPRRLMLSDKIVRLKLSMSVSGRFVNLANSCFHARDYYAAVAGGTSSSMKNVSREQILNLAIPLPPLAEQHRIVAKVNELMALCDRLETEQTDAAAAHARLVDTLLGTLTQSTDAFELAANWQRLAEHFDPLFTTESSLDALKQTILQLAVMGKLVPQDPDDEPASELLKRIAQERARLEAEGAYKKPKTTLPVDGDAFYSLPNSWQWSALDPLIRVMDSGWSPACIESSSPSNDVWGVLKTTAVQTFQYLEYENKELPDHLEPRPECEVAAGDILITRAGPKNRVAISCLVESTRPRLMISDKIIRFHLVEAGMYEKFVALCLNAGATASYLETAKSGMAASQMNITQEKLRAAPIPICSTAEQHRIVAKVDELMALCDRLKADLAESRTRQARLLATLIESALQAA